MILYATGAASERFLVFIFYLHVKKILKNKIRVKFSHLLNCDGLGELVRKGLLLLHRLQDLLLPALPYHHMLLLRLSHQLLWLCHQLLLRLSHKLVLVRMQGWWRLSHGAAAVMML
jgi:hypothetical protein